jgi:hypothetical protein
VIEGLEPWLAAWPVTGFLRRSPTAYMLANAAHVLGLGLLLGAILPLDLRLVGLFRSVPLAVVGPFLSRVAATGLTLALVTGLLLFSVRPAEYLANPAFRWKLVLLALAAANVAAQHAAGIQASFAAGRATARGRLMAGASAALWLGVLVAGRAIGFV